MNRIRSIYVSLMAVVCLMFTACAAPGDAVPSDGSLPAAASDESGRSTVQAAGEPSSSPADASTAEVPDKAAAVKLCRIISGAADGLILMAGMEESGGGLYRLSSKDLPIEGARKLRDGMAVEVAYNGLIADSYPSLFGDPAGLRVREGAADDRCALYLQALNDLWEADPALQEGINLIGLDLTQTSLTETEQQAVAWAFGEMHGLPVTHDVSDRIRTDENGFWQLEDSCAFSVREEGEKNRSDVVFTVTKWRSSLGAYGWTRCTAERGEDGFWSAYERGPAIAA